MSKFVFRGNQTALDFVNTQVMREGNPTDLLETHRDLADWMLEAGLASGREGEEIQSLTGPVAEKLMRDVHKFRGTLRTMAESLSEGRPAPNAALAAINQFLRRMPEYRELHHDRHGYHAESKVEEFEPAHALARIAKAAADLLVNGKSGGVKRCGNPDCILYFYDTTRSHTRQWCSMAGCGNRMKVAAFYKRHPRRRA